MSAHLTEAEIRSIEVEGLGDTDVHTAPIELLRVVASIKAQARRDGAVEAVPTFTNWVRHSREFWAKVHIPDPLGCWTWTAARVKPESYGQFMGTTAHRVSWAYANGRIPSSDEVVRHRCDNPICVNPAHLVVGTQQDNVNDMIERERAQWQNQTECKNGHPWIPENIYIDPRGWRACLPCHRERRRRQRKSAKGTTFVCDVCGKTLAVSSKSRHMKRVHARARAAELTPGSGT